MDSITIKKIWDSQAEAFCFEILKEFINLKNYDIICHIKLADIFFCEEKQPWDNYHIDFLIIDKKGYPILGIEVNGIEHQNSPTAKGHDKVKKSLFIENDIPLIFIPISEFPSFNNYGTEYIPALRSMIKNYLSPFLYRTAYPAYSWSCGKQYLYRYRKDNYVAFYSCPETNRTYSCDQIPELLNLELFT